MDQQISACTIKRFYADGSIVETEDSVAVEAELIIEVNGVVQNPFYCSPHSLSQLAAGYLYVEYGAVNPSIIIKSASSGICNSYTAKCVVQRDEREYNCQTKENSFQKNLFISAAAMMRMGERLLHKSDTFKMTGNIHTSMLWMEETLCYIGEDISRHNSLYRVIGACLQDGSNPRDYCLCTSGRAPYSMVQAAVKAGISVVISRSAPTDRSLELARSHGLVLAGFASANRINLYTGTLASAPAPQPNAPKSVGLVILAGGKSSRMGELDKSQLHLGEHTFLERIGTELGFFPEKLLSARAGTSPELSEFSILYDEIPGIGPMGGIYTALKVCESDSLFVAACDTPFFTREYADFALEEWQKSDCDICLFEIEGRLQPLNGIYSKSCLPVMESLIKKQQYKLLLAFDQLNLKTIVIPPTVSFMNINTQESYEKARVEYEKNKII